MSVGPASTNDCIRLAAQRRALEIPPTPCRTPPADAPCGSLQLTDPDGDITDEDILKISSACGYTIQSNSMVSACVCEAIKKPAV